MRTSVVKNFLRPRTRKLTQHARITPLYTTFVMLWKKAGITSKHYSSMGSREQSKHIGFEIRLIEAFLTDNLPFLPAVHVDNSPHMEIMRALECGGVRHAIRDVIPCFYLHRMLSASPVSVPIVVDKRVYTVLSLLGLYESPIFSTNLSDDAVMIGLQNANILDLPADDFFSGRRCAALYNVMEWQAAIDMMAHRRTKHCTKPSRRAGITSTHGSSIFHCGFGIRPRHVRPRISFTTHQHLPSRPGRGLLRP